jgi:3-hydroxyisobutyrate dehydrogenase-like beta-hydroxyacid dehydrogenase
MDIGFIGLGNMGAHMARRLVQAGHKVFIYDTRQEAIGNIAALGGIAVRSPKEIADSAETVMVSLPTPDIVLKVATGPDGVIEGKKVKRFVDLSTTGSVMAQRVFKLLAEKNIVQIDAVFGARRKAPSPSWLRARALTSKRSSRRLKSSANSFSSVKNPAPARP